MSSKPTDIIAIIISLIALILSVMGFYQQFIKASPKITYIEDWSIVRPPSPIERGEADNIFLKKLWANDEFIGKNPYFFLVYSVNITNSGEKKTDEINITFNNLPKIHKIEQGECKLITFYPCLSIIPSTFNRPVYKEPRLTLSPIPPGMTVNLRLFIQRAGLKTRITPSEIPHITSLTPARYVNYASSALPFEYGSIDDLALELSKVAEIELNKHKRIVELFK